MTTLDPIEFCEAFLRSEIANNSGNLRGHCVRGHCGSCSRCGPGRAERRLRASGGLRRSRVARGRALPAVRYSAHLRLARSRNRSGMAATSQSRSTGACNGPINEGQVLGSLFEPSNGRYCGACCRIVKPQRRPLTRSSRQEVLGTGVAVSAGIASGPLPAPQDGRRRATASAGHKVSLGRAR